ncbi:hypothetical protein D3C81_1858300 [compost metagenome]
MQGLLHLLFEADMNEHIDVQPQYFRGQQGHLLANHPQLLHGLDPVKTRRRRQIDRARQFGIGDPGIFLKAVENAYVGAIQFTHEIISPVFCLYKECLSASPNKGNELERNILQAPEYHVGQD